MEYLQKAILEKYKEHWYTLRDAGFIKNINKESVEEIESAYKKLIDPNFFVNKWCMSCVAEMLRILYIVTKFDEKEIVVETFVQEEVKQEEPIVKEEPKPQPKKRGRKTKK
jgi:thiol-disulfide isomerase/thioredoxin